MNIIEGNNMYDSKQVESVVKKISDEFIRWFGRDLENYDSFDEFMSRKEFQLIELLQDEYGYNRNCISNSDYDNTVDFAMGTSRVHKFNPKFVEMIEDKIEELLTDKKSFNESTIKTKSGKWTNKGKEGTHGNFKTKKDADAQRKAMFANGYHESINSNSNKLKYESVIGGSLFGNTINVIGNGYDKYVSDYDKKLIGKHIIVIDKDAPLLYNKRLTITDVETTPSGTYINCALQDGVDIRFNYDRDKGEKFLMSKVVKEKEMKEGFGDTLNNIGK